MTFLITLMRNTEPVVEFKDKLTEAFFEMRELLQRRRTAEVAGLNDPGVLRRLLLEYSERTLELERAWREFGPKVRAYEQFLAADGLYGLQEAARAMNAHPGRFADWLLAKGFVFRRGRRGRLAPKARLVEMGVFATRAERDEITGKAGYGVYVTPYGLDWLHRQAPRTIFYYWLDNYWCE